MSNIFEHQRTEQSKPRIHLQADRLKRTFRQSGKFQFKFQLYGYWSNLQTFITDETKFYFYEN